VAPDLYLKKQRILWMGAGNVNKKITVALVSNGGLTNLLFNINFAYAFCRQYKTDNCRVVFFGHEDSTINKELLANQNYIDDYFSRIEFKRGEDYDVCIYLRFYPEVNHESKAAQKYYKLHQQLKSWERFRKDIATRKFFEVYPEYDFNIYIYSVLNGKMCINIRDIDGSLGLHSDFDIDLSPDRNSACTVLDKLGLEAGTYLTVHTGKPPYGRVPDPTRLWEAERYESLIELLREVYPQRKIVQIGTAGNAALRGTDLNLAGTQVFSEFSAVLKYAAVHIGSDGGAVHLRRAMRGGPSVVLFGPTPSKFYGYEGNANLQGEGCPHWCAGLTDTWRNQCLAGPRPICMEAITPEMVLESVKGILKA